MICKHETEWCKNHMHYQTCGYYRELESTGIIGKWEGVPIIEIPALISWLNDQKYINVDETNNDMTEEFEREHQWELSRNCFINKMIRKLEELK